MGIEFRAGGITCIFTGFPSLFQSVVKASTESCKIPALSASSLFSIETTTQRSNSMTAIIRNVACCRYQSIFRWLSYSHSVSGGTSSEGVFLVVSANSIPVVASSSEELESSTRRRPNSGQAIRSCIISSAVQGANSSRLFSFSHVNSSAGDR